MKNSIKHYLIFTLLAALLVLSACSASPQQNVPEPDSRPIEVVEDADIEPVEAPVEQAGESSSLGYIVAGEGQLPLEVQLGAGILKLEQMGLGLSPDQIAGQLNLWTNLQILVQGNDRDQDQISTVCNQIQDGLTPDQLNALHTMNLGALTNEEVSQEISTYVQADGRNPGNGPPAVAGDQSPDRPEGERPEGERPDGQGGPGQGNPNDRLSAMVAGAIIAYLQS